MSTPSAEWWRFWKGPHDLPKLTGRRTKMTTLCPCCGERHAPAKRVMLNFRVPANIADRWRQRAAESGETLSAWLRRAAIELDKREEGPQHLPGCGTVARGCVPGCFNYDPKFDG